MGDTKRLSALASQFVVACTMCVFYYVMTLREHVPGWFFPQGLLVLGPLVYLCDLMYLRKERSLLGLCVVNALLTVGFMALYLWQEGVRGPDYLAFALIFAAWLAVRGGQLAMKGPQLRGLLLCLDVNLLTLVLFAAFAAISQVDMVWFLPGAAGFAAAVAAVASYRADQPLGWKAWCVIGLAFGAIVLGMWFLAGVAGAPVGEGLVMLWQLMAAAVNTVRGLIWRLLCYLASLLPNGTDYDQSGMWGDQSIEMPTQKEEEVGELHPIAAILMCAILAAALIALVVWAARKLAAIRLGGGKVPGVTGERARRSRPGLWKGLTTLLSRWGRALRLRRWLRKNRNRPLGLYFLLVRRSRRTPWYKRPGQTPRQFLARLAEGAREDPELHAALDDLAGRVDAALYSGREDSTSLTYAPMVRRKLGGTVARQTLRDLVSRLCARNKTKHE